MKRLTLFWGVALVICGVGSADAATYYVAPAGNDGNPGTQAAPFRTVNRGASVLRPGDTLMVRGGTYAEGLETAPSGTSWTNKVRIAAYPGETVWLAPTSGGPAVHFSGSEQYIEFDGINMDGTRGAQYYVIQIEGSSAGNAHHIRFQNAEIRGVRNGTANQGLQSEQTIYLSAKVAGAIGANEFRNLTIHGGGDSGDSTYGMYISSPDNIVEGCDIYDTASMGIQIYNGVISNGPQRNILRNNRIHDITRTGDNRIRGILVSGSDNQIYNNVIENLGATTFVRGIDVYAGSGNVISNNTIYKSAQEGILVGAAENTVVRNNVAYANGTNFANTGSGTVVSNNRFDGSDPRFVNPAAGDFHLQSASSLKDAGISVSFVSTDFEGTPRPQGAAYDIGAFEFHESVSSAAPAPPTGVRILP